MDGAKAKLRSAMLGLRPGTPDPVTPDPDKPDPDKPDPDKPNPDKPNPDKPGSSDTDTGNNGGSGSNKGDSTTGNKGDEGDKKPGTLVKTGDDQAMYIAAVGVVGLLVVGAGTVLYVKNRRQ